MEYFPVVYKEMLTFFNECKKDKKQLCLNTLLKEPMWCNKMFSYKNMSIFFQNWLKSRFKYLNDFVDSNGIKPLEWFREKLRNNNKWLCEYVIIKTVTLKALENHESSNIQYENVFHENFSYELHRKQHVKICDLNSKML
jgi:predicted secreted Zn-dependent protease